MRAVMFIHTTRRYEHSSCLIGCKLLEEADLLSLLGRQHLCSESLRRRLTSEGRIPLGQSSVVAVMLGRSNILGTLPGREYHDVFEQCVGFVIDAFDGHRQPRPEITDNIVLDKVWASMRCIAGFGAAGNVAEDDGASRCKDRLGGFILKYCLSRVANVIDATGCALGKFTNVNGRAKPNQSPSADVRGRRDFARARCAAVGGSASRLFRVHRFIPWQVRTC